MDVIPDVLYGLNMEPEQVPCAPAPSTLAHSVPEDKLTASDALIDSPINRGKGAHDPGTPTFISEECPTCGFIWCILYILWFQGLVMTLVAAADSCQFSIRRDRVVRPVISSPFHSFRSSIFGLRCCNLVCFGDNMCICFSIAMVFL